MPAIYTHNVFAKNVYNSLDENIQKKFVDKINIYEIFSQSFDFLYYYNFLSLKPGRKIRKFGRYCHRNNTQDYLLNIIKYIKNNKLYTNADVLAYLYGSINHYTCDTTMHPYVNYLCSIAKDKVGMHTKLEFEIDAYYYELINNKPFHKYNITKDLLNKVKFSSTLKECLNNVFKQTYDVDNLGKIYEKSYNQSSTIFNLAMNDKYGIKKFIYKVLDLITVHFNIKCSYCSFYIKNTDKSFLNINNEEWYNPSNKKIKSNLSWDELFDSAKDKSIKLITLCDKYFNNKISLKKLTVQIPNISYVNGLIIKQKN